MNKLTRREFLNLSGFLSALTAISACNAPIGPFTATPAAATLTSLSSEEDWLIFQTLRRITFGPRPEEIARAREIGLDNFIDEQLAPETIPDPEIEDLFEGMDTLNMTSTELTELEQRGQPVRELIRATLLRAVYSQRQLYELVVDF